MFNHAASSTVPPSGAHPALGLTVRRLAALWAMLAVMTNLTDAMGSKSGLAGGRFVAAAQLVSPNCMACHDMEQALSHPVNISPSMVVPDVLPLEGGLVTCGTCHQTDDAEAHTQAAAEHTAMLRGDRQGAAFCSQCHTDARAGSAVFHGLAYGQAHLSPATEFLSLSDEPFDARSRNCLSCHDGSLAEDLGNSHPVSVRYDELANSMRRTRRLVSSQRLDPRVRLFNGNVECGSCHSPYAGEKDMVVMSNTRGQLCRSCHDLP